MNRQGNFPKSQQALKLVICMCFLEVCYTETFKITNQYFPLHMKIIYEVLIILDESKKAVILGAETSRVLLSPR